MGTSLEREGFGNRHSSTLPEIILNMQASWRTPEMGRLFVRDQGMERWIQFNPSLTVWEIIPIVVPLTVAWN